jgi:hypothetical protein
MTKTTAKKPKPKQHLASLPKWAQARIKELEDKLSHAEQTLPWTKPGMQWFTILHPDSRAVADKGKSRKLFMLGEDHAHCICSIGPKDSVFVGRGA